MFVICYSKVHSVEIIYNGYDTVIQIHIVLLQYFFSILMNKLIYPIKNINLKTIFVMSASDLTIEVITVMTITIPSIYI